MQRCVAIHHLSVNIEYDLKQELLNMFYEQQRLMLILGYFTGIALNNKHGTAPSDISFITWSCENLL